MKAALGRNQSAAWIVLGAIAALLLRAPWSDAPLGRDEGGVAMIAGAWHHSGPFPYGSYFLDRPPLLPALYRLFGAEAGGIRLLGAVAAVLLVAVTTLLAVRLAGRAAAPWATAIAAVLASSWQLRSVFTPAELLASIPSAAAVLILIVALERERRGLWLFAVSGLLATLALLVKQSFGDALVAGAATVVAGKLLGLPWGETLRRAGAYCSGIVVVFIALVIWVLATGTTAHGVWYAMFGFRLDSASALAKHGLEMRLTSLDAPLLISGLAVAFLIALVGLWRIRNGPLVRVALFAWVVAAAAGILLGGSYWNHYLIALIAPSAAGAAALLQRNRIAAAIALVVIALPTVYHAASIARRDGGDAYQRGALTIGSYIHARSLPGSTLYVMYTKPNALYYARVRAAFPYNWSLMIRAVPGAVDRLRALIASPARPTWIYQANRTNAFAVDPTGATRRLLHANYRRVAKICGQPLWLARGARALPAPPGQPSAGGCGGG
jgi:4-amino-4-deoxy-L-arabinose transferase-like glycosyltransferase